MSREGSGRKQSIDWATQSLVYVPSEQLSRSIYTSVDGLNTRSTAASLDSWHWGAMGPSKLSGSPVKRMGRGSLQRGSQGCNDNAILQSMLMLPRVEPSYSPKIGLGDRLRTAKFQEPLLDKPYNESSLVDDPYNDSSLDDKEQLDCNQPMEDGRRVRHRKRSTGGQEPQRRDRSEDRNSVASRDSLHQILARRGGYWSTSPTGSSASVNGRPWQQDQAGPSPGDRLHGWAASPDSPQDDVPSFLRRSRANEVQEFPVSLDSSQEADGDSEEFTSLWRQPEQSADSRASSSFWAQSDQTGEAVSSSWTHAWTPPSGTCSPYTPSKTSLSRIRAKFRRNNKELRQTKRQSVRVQTPLSKTSKVTFKSPVDSDFASPTRSRTRGTPRRDGALNPARSRTLFGNRAESAALDFGSLWGDPAGIETLNSTPDGSKATYSAAPHSASQSLSNSFSKSRFLPYLSNAEFRSADLHRAQILSSPANHPSMGFGRREFSPAGGTGGNEPAECDDSATRNAFATAQGTFVPDQPAAVAPEAAKMGSDTVNKAAAPDKSARDDSASCGDLALQTGIAGTETAAALSPRSCVGGAQRGRAKADYDPQSVEAKHNSSQPALYLDYSSALHAQELPTEKDSHERRSAFQEVQSILSQGDEQRYADSQGKAVMDLAKQLEKTSLWRPELDRDLILAHRDTLLRTDTLEGSRNLPTAAEQNEVLSPQTRGHQTATARQATASSLSANSPAGAPESAGPDVPDAVPSRASESSKGQFHNQPISSSEASSSLSVSHTPGLEQPVTSANECMSSFKNPVFERSGSESPASGGPSPVSQACRPQTQMSGQTQNSRGVGEGLDPHSTAYRSPVFQRALRTARASRAHSPPTDNPGVAKVDIERLQIDQESCHRVSLDKTVAPIQTNLESSSSHSTSGDPEERSGAQKTSHAGSLSSDSWPSTLDFSLCSSPAILQEIERALQDEHAGSRRSYDEPGDSRWDIWESFKQTRVNSARSPYNSYRSPFEPSRAEGSASPANHSSNRLEDRSAAGESKSSGSSSRPAEETTHRSGQSMCSSVGSVGSCERSGESQQSGGNTKRAVRCSLLSSLNSAAETSRQSGPDKHKPAQAVGVLYPEETEHGGPVLEQSTNSGSGLAETMDSEQMMTRQQLAEAERECKQLMEFIGGLKKQLDEHEASLNSTGSVQLGNTESVTNVTPTPAQLPEKEKRPSSGCVKFPPGTLEKLQNKKGTLKKIAADLSSRGASNSSSGSTGRDSLRELGRKRPSSHSTNKSGSAGSQKVSSGSWEAELSTPPAHSIEDIAAFAKTTEKPISKHDWSRQRLWWRARLRAAEGEASRLKLQLAELQQIKGGEEVDQEVSDSQFSQVAIDCAKFAGYEEKIAAKDWLLMQLQEQMQEAEEQSSRMLHDSHARLQECESQFASAMREAEAQLAESALAEEHMTHQLQDAHLEIESLLEEISCIKEGSSRIEGEPEVMSRCYDKVERSKS